MPSLEDDFDGLARDPDQGQGRHAKHIRVCGHNERITGVACRSVQAQGGRQGRLSCPVKLQPPMMDCE